MTRDFKGILERNLNVMRSVGTRTSAIDLKER
ncbi:hypothetical protein BCL90_2972 [Pedobacter alluvionis]|uniref:Uncharacterized protein n=1 Tax=Pedobacter alluvionis TaxID=475253 RepID=A0A497XZ70_9SPHI|nr:hypothetical protein BCL90_2972 [Pedobacter alluvionis]